MAAKTQRRVSVLPLVERASSFWVFKTLATALELDLFTGLPR